MGDADDKDLLKGTWWFPARRYLPGWRLPVCWQGWLVLAGFFAMIAGGSPFLLPRHPLWFLAYLFTLTAALICVHFWKGEKLG
jgi:hypothetical protein